MRTRVLIVTIILILLEACGCNTSSRTETFKQEFDVEITPLSSCYLEIGLPYDMLVTDAGILVLAYDGAHWLHCYNKTTGELEWSRVGMGRGPGELLMCQRMSFDASTSQLYLYDSQRQELNIFRLGATTKDSPVTFIRSYDFPRKTGAQIYSLWALPNGTFLANLQRGPISCLTRYELMDNGGNTLSVCSEAPDLVGDDVYTYLQSKTAVSPNGTNFVSATLFGQIMEFYTIDNKSINSRKEKVVSAPHIVFDKGVVKNTDATLWGYPFVAASDNYVYAVLNGTKDVNNYSSLAVYDWDGNPEQLLHFDINILRVGLYEEEVYAIAQSPNNQLFLAKIEF